MMTVPTATRRLQFCAGHRVFKHESKCNNIHGHNYVVYLTAAADQLDDIGRVIDFSVLKDKFGKWIDLHWDHGMIICADDPLLPLWSQTGNRPKAEAMKFYIMPDNPTAENMAAYLLNVIGPALLRGSGVKLVEVTLHETENCYATAKLA